MRIPAGVGLFALTVILTSCSVGAPDTEPETATSSAPEETVVLLFNPYDMGEPASGISIIDSARGTCFPSVQDSGNSSAFRCFGKRRLPLDPCFRNPFGIDLLCMDNPFADTAVEFRPRGRTRAERPNPEGLPWYIQLADGQFCGSLDGATGVLNGMRMNFGCDSGGYLYGDVNMSQRLWTIHYQAKGSRTAEPMEIFTVWK
jgi:hypothetical protein